MSVGNITSSAATFLARDPKSYEPLYQTTTSTTMLANMKDQTMPPLDLRLFLYLEAPLSADQIRQIRCRIICLPPQSHLIPTTKKIHGMPLETTPTTPTLISETISQDIQRIHESANVSMPVITAPLNRLLPLRLPIQPNPTRTSTLNTSGEHMQPYKRQVIRPSSQTTLVVREQTPYDIDALPLTMTSQIPIDCTPTAIKYHSTDPNIVLGIEIRYIQRF